MCTTPSSCSRRNGGAKQQYLRKVAMGMDLKTFAECRFVIPNGDSGGTLTGEKYHEFEIL